jgi:hypothetical protein
MGDPFIFIIADSISILMKKLSVFLILIIAIFVWFGLTRKTSKSGLFNEQVQGNRSEQSSTNEPAAPIAVAESPPPVAEVKPPTEIVDLTTNKNLEQWKSIIPGIHYSSTIGKIEYWGVEHQDRSAGVPIKFHRNGDSVVFKVQSAVVSAYKTNGTLQEAQMFSPMMDIYETKKLGLQLCQMLGIDPKDFVIWCHKVGEHWMDQPLFAAGTRDHLYLISTRRTYNDEKPWFILFEIQNPSL